LNCFKNRNDKKIFVKKVKEEVLKSYFRDKSRHEILKIHSFQENESNFYFVSIKRKGIQHIISRASIIREIVTYGKSEYVFDKLFLLMNVDLVKNRDLTVLPFPIKYLRE